MAIEQEICIEQPPGMTTRVVRGTLWNLSGNTLTLLASLASTPLVIRFLGPEQYGVWSLINLLVGYIAFTDMGMGSASTRFGADAYARGDNAGEVSVIWTSFIISAIPAIAGALMLAILAGPIVGRFLQLPISLQWEAKFSLQLAAIAFVARSMSGVFNTSALVRLRMDLFVTITSGSAILQICLVPLVLSLGGGLSSAVAVVLFMAIATASFHIFAAQKLQPRLKRPTLAANLFKPLILFGCATAASSLIGLALTSAEKLLLTHYTSVVSLAHYSVAYTLASLLSIVPGAIGQSLFPAFTRLQIDSDRTPLETIYVRMLRINLFWIMPAALLLCVSARPFLTLWAGEEYGLNSTFPFIILLAGLIANVMAYVPYNLLMALGKANKIAGFHLMELIPFLLCAGILTRRYAATGAALAWTIRVLADSYLMFNAARKATGFRFSPLASGHYSYSIALAVLLLPPLFAWWAHISIPLLLSIALSSVAAYAILIWGQVLSDQERSWAVNFVAHLWRGGSSNEQRNDLG